MRVCLIGPAPPLRGGIALHTAGLASALRARGHDVEVVSYSRLYPRVFFPGSSQRDGRAAVGRAMLDTMNPRTWVRTREFLRERSPELLVAQWWHPCAAAALASVLKGTGARNMIVCHNIRPHDPTPLWRSLTRLVFGNADLALCHSRFVARELERLASGTTSRVTDMPMLLAPGGTRMRPRAQRPVALFAGLVRQYKGIEVMLEAWDRATLPPGARLVIAGESYLGRGKLERMVAKLRRCDSIDVIGRWLSDSELWELLLDTHVMLLPYLRASQSGLLPLALAAGVRVVATDAGGLAERIPRGGRHVVCKAGDARALMEALSLVLGEWVPSAPDAPRREAPEMVDIVERSWDTTVAACEWAARLHSH